MPNTIVITAAEIETEVEKLEEIVAAIKMPVRLWQRRDVDCKITL